MKTLTAFLVLILLSAPGAQAADISQTAVMAPVTTINGAVPPGALLPLQNTATMLDTVDAEDKRLFITMGTRKAGTRVGIHVHKHGGHTCVLSGEITDFVEGREPMKWPAGTCYYMPPGVPMSAANLGTVDALLIDTFNLPRGEDYITILEPGYPGYAAGVSK
ncbi:cupin domain-containing protein [Aestuariivirga sp.]|uniref:cupin domain-containing protein n=1 Tax=Aestuariivirga sp. TaxID=2650926 RepID=UPI003BAB44D0